MVPVNTGMSMPRVPARPISSGMSDEHGGRYTGRIYGHQRLRKRSAYLRRKSWWIILYDSERKEELYTQVTRTVY